MLKKMLLLTLFSLSSFAGTPPASPQNRPPENGRQDLQDHLQQHLRDQQRARETLPRSGGTESQAMDVYRDIRTQQERRTEIQRKELQEGASPQTTLQRTLEDQAHTQRRTSVAPLSAAGDRSPEFRSGSATGKPDLQAEPRHYERTRSIHRITLHKDNQWSLDQRSIGERGIRERLSLFSQDTPPPVLEVSFGSDVPQGEREKMLQELNALGFSEIRRLPDQPPKQPVPKMPQTEPAATYHWWQPEWWITPR